MPQLPLPRLKPLLAPTRKFTALPAAVLLPAITKLCLYYRKVVDSAGDYFLRSTPSTGGSSIALRHDGTKWEFIDVDTTTVLLQQVVEVMAR